MKLLIDDKDLEELKDNILLEYANKHSYEDWSQFMNDSHEHTQLEATKEVMDTYLRLVLLNILAKELKQ